MASQIYGKAREAFAKGLIDWTGGTIRVIGVDAADYTLAIDTHEFLSDIPAIARIGNSGGTTRGDGTALTGRTATLGVLDAADATLTAVTGDQFEYLVIYVDDGVADTSSRLIMIIDTATGLPITPSGGNVTITWSDGANKIAKL